MQQRSPLLAFAVFVWRMAFSVPHQRRRFGRAYGCLTRAQRPSFRRYFLVFFPINLVFFTILLRPDSLLLYVALVGASASFPLIKYSLLHN